MPKHLYQLVNGSFCDERPSVQVIRLLKHGLNILFIFFFSGLFRERVGEGQKERKRERIPTRLCAVGQKPDAGFSLTNCEIMTSAEVRHLTD